MAGSWTFAVARDNLGKTALVESATPAIAGGEALLRVDRVGLTANNVTYAVLGEAMRYWQFFPPGPRGLGPEWGLPPLWGFADVVESSVPGVVVGERIYGYLPPAGHLVVRPDRVDAAGFRDASEHRVELPSAYNAYRSTVGDAAYRADQEDLLILFRPLFFTSFMLADQVADNGFYGAQALVFSSASSKTAYATAFELHGRGPRLVGLTAPGNLEFTRSLGCYDEVVSYADIGGLDVVPTAYLDLSGAPSHRAAIRERLGDQVVRDVIVGLTNQIPISGPAISGPAISDPAVPDPAREMFFAPSRMRKRSQDWGSEGLDQRFAVAWQRFAGVVDDWLDVHVGGGPDALQRGWLEVLAGRVPPRVGQIIQL